MLDNIIDTKASRFEILKYIISILTDVNDKIILPYFNKLSPMLIPSISKSPMSSALVKY